MKDMMSVRHWKYLLGAGLVLLVLTFAGCQPEGMSIDERIDAFLSDAEGGGDLSSHFSDVSAGLISPTTFSSGVLAPATGGFSWTESARTDTTRTGTIVRAAASDWPGVVFTMKKETLTGLMGGEDWKILNVVIDGTSYPTP